MRQGTIVTVKPDGHPLSVFEAKRQLRIEPEDIDQDNDIASLCAAVHRKVERELGFPILRQTRETHMDGFGRGAIWLGGGDSPVITAIRYIDPAGDQQVLGASEYSLDAISRGPRVFPAPHKAWPSTICDASAVVIEWQAGWINPSDVPEDLILAMKLLVGHWDANREAVVTGAVPAVLQLAVEELLAPFRIAFVA